MVEKNQDLIIPILSKLYRRKLWGKSYTTIENSLSKIPKHNRGKAKEALENLRKEDLVLFHKRKSCVSLNPDRKNEIEQILEDHLPDYLI